MNTQRLLTDAVIIANFVLITLTITFAAIYAKNYDSSVFSDIAGIFTSIKEAL